MAAKRPQSPALPLAALAAETFIVYRRRSGPGLYDAIFAACHAAGFSPLVGQEAPRIVSTLNLVATGLGIAIVPASLQRMQMDGVVYRRLTGTQPRAPLLLATRPRRYFGRGPLFPGPGEAHGAELSADRPGECHNVDAADWVDAAEWMI